MRPAELKAIRKRYGLSVDQLAALLRVASKRTVMRWETGEVPVSGPASIIYELMDADELPNRFWP
jgi:DNA-binding transcriptional regulator YiaG